MSSFTRGSWVVTATALDSDVPGKELPAGTRGRIHELPEENEGMYAIAVGNLLYDCSADELGAVPAVSRVCARAACDGVALKRCSRCRSVWYCSKRCQRQSR